MKPPPFSYVRPESVPEVLSCLARWGEDGKILAGGQSLIPLLNLRLARVTTIEGLRKLERTSALLTAFAARHVLQCGFCTPGMLVTIAAADPGEYPDDGAIRELISGNLCRCTGYQNIVQAVREAWGRSDDDA